MTIFVQVRPVKDDSLTEEGFNAAAAAYGGGSESLCMGVANYTVLSGSFEDAGKAREFEQHLGAWPTIYGEQIQVIDTEAALG